MRGALARCAGQLSHAGRLAAQSAPVEHGAVEEAAAAGPPPTVDAPPLAVPGTQARWSQHQAGGEPAKGGTQEAPKELIQELTRPQPHATATHARPHDPAAGGFYAPPPGVGQPYPPASAIGATPYGSQVTSRYGARGRRPSRVLGAVIALILGVIVTGAVVAALALSRRDRDEPVAATQTTAIPTTEATTVVTAEAPPPSPPTPVAPAVPDPQPTSPRPTKPRPSTPDAGAASPDAGGVLPFPQIQLPSGFPPLPSSLPPLPSGFPQIPGLPFPTEQPGPASAPSG
jgi:hypothetical protein